MTHAVTPARWMVWALVASLAVIAIDLIASFVERDGPRGDRAAPLTAGGAVRPPEDGAYLGAWTSSNTGTTLTRREAQIGRRFAIAHVYHDWNDVFPTRRERAWTRHGRTLFISWSSRIYETEGLIRWDAIAAGSEDRAIDAAARRVRALGRPVLLSFFHEPDAFVGTAGSAADFAAAFRHIRARFIRRGATNVAWVWAVQGGSDNTPLYEHGLYPGDAAVDWIAWDPFNWYTCNGTPWQSLGTKVSPFYNWLTRHGYGNRPFMLAEFGSAEYPGRPRAKGKWLRDAAASLRRFPNIKAVVYFDSRHTQCDWRIDSSRQSLAGFRKFAADPYVNP
jgi:hypothetical protein